MPEDDAAKRITLLLSEIGKDETGKAAAELLPLVYEQLREMADRAFRNQPAGHTLQPTALVSEAYLRLAGKEDWAGRDHFFAVAASAMRQILVDHARRKRAAKRGGAWGRMSLQGIASGDGVDADLLDLDEALMALASEHERSARVVEMRFFGGLTEDSAAKALGVSRKTAAQDWAFARAWLSRRLRGTGGEGGG